MVFVGCCYGGLIVDGRACDAVGTERSLGPEASIAMRFLAAGTKAFVGPTGVHYSPIMAPYDEAAGPLHAAFWSGIAAGAPPAEALYEAKVACILSLRPDLEPGEKAIAFKTWRQFTCLGLGW